MRARAPCCGLVALLVGCDPGDVTLVAPEPNESGSQAISVQVVVDTPYSELAESLGWTSGVPNAVLRLHRMDEPYDESYWSTAVTDSAGVALFPAQLSGIYEVPVSRALSPTERAATGSVISLMAGGRRLRLFPGAGTMVTVAPNRPGLLLFSEVEMEALGALDQRISGDAKYFEIYNNSDSMAFLDGTLWGVAWSYLHDYPNWPCDETAAIRTDPEGVWTHWFFRFPGSGTDYPLAPGALALIAKAAIDHRAVDPRMLDLSHASFEWGGSSTADNPEVPNLASVGPGILPPNLPLSGEFPLFLASPTDLDGLPRYIDPPSGSVWIRIPRSAVLDTWVNPVDWTTHNYEVSPACLEDLHRNFERLGGPAEAHSDFDNGLSIQRRILGVLPDGRKRLQDTNTSMEDFVKAARTPGWIPDSLR